jgi:hypothetical protein
MTNQTSERHFDTVVVGGGQAVLAFGYHLAQQHRHFVILDAESRVGNVWRNRWDSLRLFTPARYDGLPGMPFPAPDGYFPTKDEMADYLGAYAARFDLPVRPGVRVDALKREEGRYLLTSGNDCPAALVPDQTEPVPLDVGSEWQQRGSSGNGKRRHLATVARTIQSSNRLIQAYRWPCTICRCISYSAFAQRRPAVRIPSAPL